MGLYILVSVLILIVCVLLGLIVLVQDSKGGGLASNFASSNQYMGVRKTADFLEKSTWILATLLLVFSLVSVFVIPRNQSGSSSGNPDMQMIQERAMEQGGQAPVDYTPPPAQEDAPAPSEEE